MSRKMLILTVAAGAAVCAQSLHADVVALPAATQELLATYRGTDVHMDQGRVRIIYGAPMTQGATPEHAAATWLEEHGEALGAPDPDLRLAWSATLRDDRFTVFAFEQFIDDMPVEAGIARILVQNHPVPQVVYAAGTLAPTAGQDFVAPALDDKTAVALVRAQRLYQHLPEWSEPELAVFQGMGEWREPVLTWKFRGTDPNLERLQDWTFFVDTQTGNVVHVRNEVHYNTDIVGNVRAWATPGMEPDMPTNPTVLGPLGDIRLNIFNGTSGMADADGSFVLSHFGTDPVEMRVRLGPALSAGRWVAVNDASEPVEQLSLSVTPPGPVDVIFNQARSEARTAQINAFVHVNSTNEFFRSRAGSWGGITHTIRANVNLGGECNAFYGGGSLGFFASGACVNSAYSSVIAHEYGHHIVNQLGLGQGGFGEGFADLISMLQYDDSLIGRSFEGPGTPPIRDPRNAGVNYPCPPGEGIHYCGQILGGAWWRIRENMGAYYGSEEGLERTQQLFVDWALITTGGTGPSFVHSAHPATAIEVLVVNNDDGTFATGTPDLPRICPAFDAHDISCPDSAAVKWEFAQELPSILVPDQPTQIEVTIHPMARTPTDHTGRLHYRVDGGSWVQTNMTRTAPHEYTGTIPGQPCGSVVDYYFTVNVPGIPPTGTVFYPDTVTDGGEGRPLFAASALSLSTVYEENFEEENDWVGSVPSDDAITGRWTWGIPEATAAQPGTVPTHGGVRCWVTDYRAGVQVSDYDVDGGKTTLMSPLIDLQGRNNPIVSFWAWYSNDVGPVNANTNIFEIDVSADDGASWVNAISLGPDGPGTSGGWRFYRFRLNDFVSTTSNFRIRFVASDYTGAIVEAAVDDFAIHSVNCGAASSVFCYANCTGSTTEPILTVDDFICFIDRFAAGDPWANCDGSTTEPMLTADDFVCFINAFAQGCP